MVTVLNIQTIISDSALRDGKPIIAGTALTVAEVIAYYQSGSLTPQDLADVFKLDLGQVHAVLAYYYQHQDEIDHQIALLSQAQKDAVEPLWQQVYRRLSWQDEIQLKTLTQKSKMQKLSAQEQQQLDRVIELFDELILQRSEAMLMLKQRGFSVEKTVA